MSGQDGKTLLMKKSLNVAGGGNSPARDDTKKVVVLPSMLSCSAVETVNGNLFRLGRKLS